MGATYAEKTKNKKANYRKAIKYCEKAMSTNEAFSRKITKEKDITSL